ncbi:hypothetical protein M3Y98_01004000 [Aphelenchoides besseyi]|nr:hypothetical protein M3Y98_01004000 [Aphelenchoides besseyi]
MGLHYSEHCCCGIHVHKGCLIIAILGIIGNISMSFNWYGTQYGWYFSLSGVSSLISLICYICLLIGNLKRMSVLYLPSLILNTIVLILTCFLIIYLIIAAILVFAGKMHVETNVKVATGTFTIIVGVLFLLSVLIQAYFTHVIWRGWKYLKEECGGHHSHGHAHTTHVAHVHHVA